MSVLLCDSNCELWYTTLKELGLDYISMPYYYDGEEYYYDCGEKTDFKKFYNAVRNGSMPNTMALNPENYKEILTKYFKKGEDVLYVSFSHAMSGTFDHLNTALNELKETFPDRKCTVFNTNSISLGAGMQVLGAALKKKQGASDDEIIDFLKDFTNKISVYFVVDDLMHLKRGGRLKTAAAVAGTVLGIKPMLTVDGKGNIAVFEKAVGRKKSINALADKVVKELTDTYYPVFIIEADCGAEAEYLEGIIKKSRPEANVVRQTVGPVIGTHCGPGTLGVIFVSESRPIKLEA